MSLVSCLMVTHGRYNLTCQALSCFFAQDYPHRELLILNHHPVPLKLGAAPPAGASVQIFNEPNTNTFGANLNLLLDRARGEFLRTWDSDDHFLPWCISQGVEMIGDRPAWKPARSWFVQGESVTLEANNFEPSILWRREFVAAHRFHEGEVESTSLFGALPERVVPSDELGIWSPFVTMWGNGVWHLSGSLGSGTPEERHRIWREHNQDTGEGRPLVPARVDSVWLRIASHINQDERRAWLERALA